VNNSNLSWLEAANTAVSFPLEALPICVARTSRTADLSPYEKRARYGTLLTFTSALQILEQWVWSLGTVRYFSAEASNLNSEAMRFRWTFRNGFMIALDFGQEQIHYGGTLTFRLAGKPASSESPQSPTSLHGVSH